MTGVDRGHEVTDMDRVEGPTEHADTLSHPTCTIEAAAPHGGAPRTNGLSPRATVPLQSQAEPSACSAPVNDLLWLLRLTPLSVERLDAELLAEPAGRAAAGMAGRPPWSNP